MHRQNCKLEEEEMADFSDHECICHEVAATTTTTTRSSALTVIRYQPLHVSTSQDACVDQEHDRGLHRLPPALP
jgi:hypothetical protein